MYYMCLCDRFAFLQANFFSEFNAIIISIICCTLTDKIWILKRDISLIIGCTFITYARIYDTSRLNLSLSWITKNFDKLLYTVFARYAGSPKVDDILAVGTYMENEILQLNQILYMQTFLVGTKATWFR